jgi:hypothetical protein
VPCATARKTRVRPLPLLRQLVIAGPVRPSTACFGTGRGRRRHPVPCTPACAGSLPD